MYIQWWGKLYVKEAAKQEDHAPPGIDCKMKAVKLSDGPQVQCGASITEVISRSLFRRL